MKKAYRFAKRFHTIVDIVYKVGRIVVMAPVVIHLASYLVDGFLNV